MMAKLDRRSYPQKTPFPAKKIKNEELTNEIETK
jgi:hypothetical protein